MKSIFVGLLLLASSGHAKTDYTKLVPGGKVLEQSKIDIKIKTKAGTHIEIGIDDDGEMEEASGSAAHKGDEFEPGNKLVSLKVAVENLVKAGKSVQGEWIFEENEEGEWIYDIEGEENKKPVDYIVSAKDGKLLKTEVDE